MHPNALTGSRAGEWFSSILQQNNLPTERVVIEILEGAIDDNALLVETIANYRARGYRIAIDDFGRGHSNLPRFWQISPDIVKFDREIIAAAASTPKVRNALPKLVALMHEFGSQVLIEGIETVEHATIALEAHADLLQGYLFARPSADIAQGSQDAEAVMARLLDTPDWVI